MNKHQAPVTVPQTVAELIDNWKTIGEFASDIECGYEAARVMRRNNSITPLYWVPVIREAQRKGVPGVSLEWLDARYRSAKPQSEDAE